MGTPLSCHRSIAIVADGRLEVCDDAHRIFVMERGQRPRPSLRDGAGHTPVGSESLAGFVVTANARHFGLAFLGPMEPK
jgi:hypothetical protein